MNYLSKEGYHPRSSKHGDKLCRLLLDDLIATCPVIRDAFQNDSICYDLNFSPGTSAPLGWNIDLAVGPPPKDQENFSSTSGSPLRIDPSELWISVDTKTIMTEHGKARRNRQRDLNSFASILHMKNPKTIVGGLMVINISPRYRSPLRDDITIHKNITRLVSESVRLFEDLPRASPSGASPGNLNQIDAVGVIVINHSGVIGDTTNLVTDPPAPQPDSPVQYESFVKDICEAFKVRFAK